MTQGEAWPGDQTTLRLASYMSLLLPTGVAHANHGGRGSVVLDFDLDRGTVPDGLGITAEVAQVCCRANRESVALETSRQVNNAISSHGTRRDTSVCNDVQIWVTRPGRLQNRG